MAEHSDCNNCENKEAWAWADPMGRSTSKKICYTMKVVTKYGEFEIPLACKYHSLPESTCSTDVAGSPLNGLLSSNKHLKSLLSYISYACFEITILYHKTTL